MRARIQKISKYAPSIFQGKLDFSSVQRDVSLSLEHPVERAALRILSIVLLVAICGYLYFVSASILNVIARKEAQPDDTPGFKIEDSNWNAVEVAIPWSLIGGNPAPPAGQTWKFIVAAGQQDNDITRTVEEQASEWHGGGGSANTANPNVYDLAGTDKAAQEKELGSYDPETDQGDPKGFATIDKSYLTVNFGLMK